ncbi:MAG: response regulator transcription factor [Eubacteriales bacterium]|nr:response regulator transcription factor [Eubacteriales bacterium]
MSGTILLVEDELKLARFVELELIHEGYAVEKAADGRSGLEMALEKDYALILLDVMLPGLSGMEVLRRLRREKQTPVILVTARDAVMDKVTGLDMGADDYITKPFEIEELLARIRVATRRRAAAPAAQEEALVSGPLSLDPARRTLTYAGEAVVLTHREFELLHALMANRDIVLSREKLLEKVWGYDYAGETNVVDVYIRYLRAKIDDRFGVKYLHTVRGVGYVFRDRE